LKKVNLFLKHDVPQHRKTETHHGNAPRILFGARTTTTKSLKEAGFVFLLHTFVYCLKCTLMSAETTKCAHFLIRKGICDWKLRSHEQLMEHKDATITFSRRCN